MKKLIATAASFQRYCESNGLPFCFIGGLALQSHGEPRVTLDVDVSVYTGFERDDETITLLLKGFEPRRPDAAQFAQANRVLLLKSSDEVGIDVALAGLAYEKQVIDRAELVEYLPGVALRICGVNDLIVLKAFANRRRDWADIEGILRRQQNKLDWPYIGSALEPLAVATDRPELVDLLRTLRRELSSE
jgi:hypothetical protein